MEHNLIKKNYSQIEAGKRYFIKLYKQAVKIHDEKMINFCKCIFDCYDFHGVNGHIPRPNGKKKIRKRREQYIDVKIVDITAMNSSSNSTIIHIV